MKESSKQQQWNIVVRGTITPEKKNSWYQGLQGLGNRNIFKEKHLKLNNNDDDQERIHIPLYIAVFFEINPSTPTFDFNKND